MSLEFKKMNSLQLSDYKPLDGEICQVVDGDVSKYMIYNDGKWVTLKMDDSGINIGLYELNQQIISQLPTLEDVEEKIELINNLHDCFHNTFYMLYGKEISYFTLFETTLDHPECYDLGHGVIECLANVGEIKSIEATTNADAIEIWVQQADSQPTCLYLFPYDNGIVKVGVSL